MEHLNNYFIIKKRRNIFLFLLSLVIFGAFHYSLLCGFVNWDDHIYVTKNIFIQQFSWFNIKYIFTHVTPYKQYLPLVNLSLMIDYQIAGDNPFVFHLINVLFHTANALLVFFIIQKVTKNFFIAAVTALLFGLHPIQVESVTWVTERKNVLFAFFFFGSLFMYVKYLESKKIKQYLWSLALFIVALFAKSSAVTLGVILFLFDYLYRRKLLSKRVINEKLPFLAIAAIFGYITIMSHTDSISHVAKQLDFGRRLIIAIYNYFNYIINLAAPTNLSPFYPYPSNIVNTIPLFYKLTIAVAVAFVPFFILNRKKRLFVFGILFYTINIGLFLQLIPNSSFVSADRYTYIAGIGIFFIIAVALNKISQRMKPLMIYIPLTAYFFFLVVYTYQKTKVWENSRTLWTDVTSKYQHDHIPWFKLGEAYFDEGDNESALKYFNTAVTINPNDEKIYNKRGMAKGMLNDIEGAFSDLSRAILLNPDFNEPYINRGNVLIKLGQYEEAVKDLDKAYQIFHYSPVCLYNRGRAHMFLGNYEKAVHDFSITLGYNANNDEALYARGYSYFKQGDNEKGCLDLYLASQLGNEPAKKLAKKYCRKTD